VSATSLTNKEKSETPFLARYGDVWGLADIPPGEEMSNDTLTNDRNTSQHEDANQDKQESFLTDSRGGVPVKTKPIPGHHRHGKPTNRMKGKTMSITSFTMRVSLGRNS